MGQSIATLEAQIEAIKRELVGLGDLRPGSLSQQYNVCGNPKCRCKASPPQKHGPYYQISFTRNGKSNTQFVRAKDVATVKKQLRSYVRLRRLVDRWVDLAAQVAALRLRQGEDG